jgi:hypothetical protein
MKTLRATEDTRQLTVDAVRRPTPGEALEWLKASGKAPDLSATRRFVVQSGEAGTTQGGAL